ncbi:hypothetical protein LCGC14_2068260 [marine sediment metagenome]|uniref:PilZ domain-containing protein n=1 Tax=marine sediment metagenome TaxID=412755 RepID=A0A0F9GXM4_9ZZZZ
MENRRMHPRASLVKGATLFYNNGNSSLPCVVVDRSESGAKIRINNYELFKCPEIFQLKYSDVDKIHKCRRMWSDKNTIGIEFI